MRCPTDMIVSLDTKVTNFYTYTSPNKIVVYKYQLQDNSNDITLAAFRALDFQVDKSYHINNVEINAKGPTKSLKYLVISSHNPCKKEVKVTSTPSNQRNIKPVRHQCYSFMY